MLDTHRGFRQRLYQHGARLLHAYLQKNAPVAPADLTSAAPIARCAGDYRPTFPNALTADQLAMELEKAAPVLADELARAERERTAATAEEVRCQADHKCVRQREIDSILGDLCPLLAEIDETKARLKARLKEAKKYGIINKADQYEDMEDKQFSEERAAELKRDYREVAGKKFVLSLCKEYE